MKPLYLFIRTIVYFLLVPFLRAFSASMRSRYFFEQKNRHDPYFQVPKDKSVNIAFEVSSEGELEQIRNLLEHLLEHGRVIQLIYCSQSVEKHCQDIAKKFQGQLYLMRLPILSVRWPLPAHLDVIGWLKAPLLVLCRYDFFPEFFIYARKNSASLYLLSASAKGLERKMRFDFLNKLYRGVYKQFDKILAATSSDQNQLSRLLGLDNLVGHYDFRVLRIINRLKVGNETLYEKVPHFAGLYSTLQQFAIDRRFIWGSFWPKEMECFLDPKIIKDIRDKKIICCLAPHQVDHELLGFIKRFFIEHQIKLTCYHFHTAMSAKDFQQLHKEFVQKPGLILINVKGVLCELYQLFGHAYVGGGHGRSIHSVLEPYLAGCQVYCGPRVHRSTEFDFVLQNSSEKAINIIDEMSSFYQQIQWNRDRELVQSSHSHDTFYQEFFSILGQLNLSQGQQDA